MIRHMGVVFPNLFSFVHAPPVRDGDDDDDGVRRDAPDRPGVDGRRMGAGVGVGVGAR